MKAKTKKIMIYAGGGVGGLFVLLVVAGALMGPMETGQGDEEDPYYDPRLTELRERDGELDDVFQPQDSGTYQLDETAEDAFVPQGELIDFDSLPDESVPSADDEMVSPGGDEADEVEAPVAEPAPAPQPRRAAPAVTSDEVVAINDRLDQMESSLDEMQMAQPGVDEGEVSALRNQIMSIESSQNDLMGMPDMLAGMNEQLEGFAQRINKLEEDMAEKKESSQKATRSAPARPSSQVLGGLYALDRIEQGVAVLIGQNTGKTYTLAEGDSLAYGGKVHRVSGDTVTLRWPHFSTTLTVF